MDKEGTHGVVATTALPMGLAVQRRPARLLMAFVCLFLLAWVMRYNSPKDDGCEGGCFQKKPNASGGQGRSRRNKMKKALEEEEKELLKQAAQVDLFSTPEEDLSQLTPAELDLDDEEREKEEDDDSVVEVEEDDETEDGTGNDASTHEKRTIKIEIPSTSEDDDDDDEIGEGNGKFKPIREGTLGYDMMHYKQPLDRLSETTLKIDGDSSFEARGIPLDAGAHLITTFFRGTYHDRRFKEIMATLVSNLENPEITAVHLMWQDADPRYFIPDEIAEKMVERGLHKKLVLTEVKKQPTYKLMFSYANSVLKRGAVAIVTNADIYFDHTVRCVSLPPKNFTVLYNYPEKIKNRVAFALSRRHSDLCKGKPDHRSYFDLCERYTLSHDAFVFAPPIPKSIVMRTDHTQNQGYGAENIVIFEFKRENFRVLNPCFTLKGFHLHCVSERHYVANFINRVPPRPGASVPIKKKCGMWVY